MVRLKDILHEQRKRNFVGRQKELDFFSNLLKEEQLTIHLIHLHDPEGQGKTTLLKQFADRCKESAIPFIHLDCHNIASHPESFKQAFQTASPFSGTDLMAAIDAHKEKVVLLIDTYEKLKPLDDWLRLDFLPELPANVITVISSRSQLSTNWKTDPGWQSITRTFLLQELTDQESAGKLHLMGRQEINQEETTITPPQPAKAGITEQDFIEAVQEGLKQLNNPKKMVGNLLLKLRFVQQANEDEPTDINLALTLADKLTRVIASLENSPKDETLHRVLYRTFINPVGNQEQTADFLYMSFSTYRRQIKKGVERIADILWLEEKK